MFITLPIYVMNLYIVSIRHEAADCLTEYCAKIPIEVLQKYLSPRDATYLCIEINESRNKERTFRDDLNQVFATTLFTIFTLYLPILSTILFGFPSNLKTVSIFIIIIELIIFVYTKYIFANNQYSLIDKISKKINN
jgi:hypothetical protein